MRYEEFVFHLAAMSEQSEEAVRTILLNFPDALSILKEGESLRTPLGVFRAVSRKTRMCALPKSDKEFPVVPELAVKLRSGSRLRFRR